jgi:30S ribosomal protein S31
MHTNYWRDTIFVVGLWSKINIMGRGDIRSKKGKIAAGSYGNSRPHKEKAKPAEPKAVKAPAKAKKTTKKKSEE